jgi:predicted nucleic acid-binding protein
MIVVDVSVVAYLLIEGDKSPLALQVYQRDAEWCVPALWRYEFLNVLGAYVRQGGGNPEDAEAIWQRAVRWLGGQEKNVDLVQALRLAHQHSIIPSDAQYIELATALGLHYVTEKPQLLELFPLLTKSMQAFVEGE